MGSNGANIWAQLIFAIPDVLSGMALLASFVAKCILDEKWSRTIFPKFSMIISFVCLVMMLVYGTIGETFSNSLFVYNPALFYMKAMSMACAFVVFFVISVTNIYKMISSYTYIYMFGVINAINICLVANHLLSLLLGLELYTFSICFSLMIQHNKTGAKARKCSVRFLLTSYTMTAILLYGMSMYYLGSGSLSFPKINFDKSFAATVGTALVTSALLFKLGVAPFHSWMVDVYDKASTGLVVFFDAIWKFFMAFIFIRFFKFVLHGNCQFHAFLMPLSILSMLMGSVMPIFQKDIKKFVAYASVGHMGFVMTVFAIADKITATSDVLLYIISYSLASICFFTTILSMKKYRIVTTFDDLMGLIKDAPMLGGSIIVSMFAMIGLPPFINFIAKLQILKLQLSSGNYILLAVSIIYSVFSILYASKCVMNIFNKGEGTDQMQRPKGGPLLALSLCILLISPLFYVSVNDWFVNILKNI
ncbi:MAG: hypothetical protein LBJ92_02825 [Holosporales bacterium]|nr:hypothetical protein [Holosporales bacterium]